MKTFIKTAWLVALALTLDACSGRPLLQGVAHFEEYTDFAVNYTPDDCILTAQILDLECDQDGRFALSAEQAPKPGSYELLIGNKVYGVYLEKGKTLELEVTPLADGTFDVQFAGENAGLSRFVSVLYAAYDIMEYGSMEPDGTTNDQYLAKLDGNRNRVEEAFSLIADSPLRAHYEKLSEYTYTALKMRLLLDRAYENDEDVKTYPEFRELLQACNPDCPEGLQSAYSFIWLSNVSEVEDASEGDLSASAIDQLRIIREQISQPTARKMLCYLAANTFFAYGDGESGKEEFWKAFCETASDFPDLIEIFQPEYEKEIVHMENKPLPNVPVVHPDGSSVELARVVAGKLTYIDIWATWCGPCCREIPYLEKLVEEMKSEEGIRFVSLSVDEDEAAWQAKLAADKPQWEQYLLNGQAGSEFSAALDIRGIPRFILVGADGNILVPDAPRPSSDGIKEFLLQYID